MIVERHNKPEIEIMYVGLQAAPHPCRALSLSLACSRRRRVDQPCRPNCYCERNHAVLSPSLRSLSQPCPNLNTPPPRLLFALMVPFRGNKELLLNPIMVSRNEKEKVLIEVGLATHTSPLQPSPPPMRGSRFSLSLSTPVAAHQVKVTDGLFCAGPSGVACCSGVDQRAACQHLHQAVGCHRRDPV